MLAKPDEFTPLEKALIIAAENNASSVHFIEEIRNCLEDKKPQSPQDPDVSNNLLDLSDLDDDEEDIVFDFEEETSDRNDEDEMQQEKGLAFAMHDYLMEYRKRFAERANTILWMQQKRLPMQAYEFDDAIYKLYHNQKKRNSGACPKYFAQLESVRSILGEEFSRKICECHELTENDFMESVGNKISQNQMDYLTCDGRYNYVFAEDIEGVLTRRQTVYTELDKELEHISPEYASIDLNALKEQLNIPKTHDAESDDFYFGTNLMNKIDNMLENGASAEEIKKEILIFTKQSIHHEITTLCRDNNEERVKLQPLESENRWIRGVDKNLESYPLISFDALFAINVKIARKTLNNAINRDHYLLGGMSLPSNQSMPNENNETELRDAV